MPQPRGPRPVTGDDILSELLRNVKAGAFTVRRTTIVPCVFNVYLHPDDFEQVQPIAGFLREEARKALDDHLAGLNRGSRIKVGEWLGMGDRPKHEFKKLHPEWTIEFQRDGEERLERGDIEVFSELGSSEKLELGEGGRTTFITRRPAETDVSPTVGTRRPVYAYIRYDGLGGPVTFPVTANEITIGRGAKVDLTIKGPTDISREHCRIQRDPETGAFTLQDLSTFGTTVNAKPAAKGGSALPSPARIGLAGIFFLEFEAARTE